MLIDAPSFGAGVRPAVLNIIYPGGSGPWTRAGTGNVYHLLAKICISRGLVVDGSAEQLSVILAAAVTRVAFIHCIKDEQAEMVYHAS
jgi:hypothetical protein